MDVRGPYDLKGHRCPNCWHMALGKKRKATMQLWYPYCSKWCRDLTMQGKVSPLRAKTIKIQKEVDMAKANPKPKPKAGHSGIFPRTADASTVCACGVMVPQNICNGIESDLIDTQAEVDRLKETISNLQEALEK